MKKLLFILVVAYMGNLQIVAQQDWFWVNPAPSSGSYKKISFTDPNNGTIVGVAGIIRTKNGGDNWKWQKYNKEPDIENVCFVDSTNGWAVGAQGTIVRTTDAGETWIDQISGTTQTLRSVHFIDVMNGITVGSGGTVRQTTNGGVIWNPLSIVSTSTTLYDVYFSDINNITITGSGGNIRRSTDGGNTWSSQSSGTTATLLAIHFINANVGTIVGTGGTIRRTTDGGINWMVQSAATGSSFQAVSFVDEYTGFISGPTNQYYKTTDGGISWLSQSIYGTGVGLDIKFFNADSGIIIGQFEILETNDGGLTWINHHFIEDEPYFDDGPFNAIHVFNQDSYALINTYANLQHFYITSDNGQSWNRTLISTDAGELLDMCFTNENFGITCTANGRIFITTNRGLNWSSKVSGTSLALRSISFSSTQTGTIVGSGGKILRTTDSGQTWLSQTSGTSNTLYDVYFIDENLGTAVGANSTILRTIDGGVNWSPQTSPVSSANLLDVSFLDENNGMIVGNLGTILKTSDGGLNWTISNFSYPTMIIKRIIQIDNNNSTIIGDRTALSGLGYIFSTSDGGNSWELERYTDTNLKDISSFNSSTLFVVGIGGTILKSLASTISVNNSPQFISSTPACGYVFMVDVGHPLSFTVAAEDVDAGDVVSLSVSGLPSGSSMSPVLPASGNPVSSDFNWTPTLADVGTYKLNFEITDNHSAPVSCSFTVEVVNINAIPAFVEPTPTCGTTLSAYVGDEFTFTLSVTDVDAGDILSLSSGELPPGSSMNPVLPLSGNPVTSQFSWTPELSSVGNHIIVFKVTDHYSDTIYCSYTVEVINDNVAPTFVSPTPACDSTLTADVGSPFSFTITAEDANLGDVIVLSSSSLPVGSAMDPVLPLSGNPVSSLFSWTPTAAAIGTHQIIYTISDVQNYQTVCSLTVEVADVPPPPQLPCPLSQGYWKNHTANWPPSAIPMTLGTTNSYDDLQLLSILNSAVRGDGSIILAHQLIAAKLNVANGSPLPSAVADAITGADAAIGELTIPAGIKANSTLRTTMITLAAILDDYNNNLLTTDCTLMGKNGLVELEPVTEYALFSNYPNPFNPTTKISWQAPTDGKQTLKIFDVLGNEVEVLVDEFRPAGRYEATFDASSLASGIYIYILQAGDFVQTKKMILMK